MKEFDKKIVDDLMGMCDIAAYGPGALLYNPNERGKNIQCELLASILERIRAKYVLETGTESGMFSYFAKHILSDVKVVTFGLGESKDMRSDKCVDYLNERFGNYITYIVGDSVETLTNFVPWQQISFAWIDGGHYGETPYIDLKNCNRLRIPHICVDDYNLLPDVKSCTKRFLVDFPDYKVETITGDDRGICYMSNPKFEL